MQRDILCCLAPNVNPDILGLDQIDSARDPINKLTIKGESRHPCQVLFMLEKVHDSIFEVYTWAHGK